MNGKRLLSIALALLLATAPQAAAAGTEAGAEAENIPPEITEAVSEPPVENGASQPPAEDTESAESTESTENTENEENPADVPSEDAENTEAPSEEEEASEIPAPTELPSESEETETGTGTSTKTEPESQPTPNVEVPASGRIIFNPYCAEIELDGETSASQIISTRETLVNRGEVAVEVSMMVTASPPEGREVTVQDTPLSPDTLGKAVFLYVEWQPVTGAETVWETDYTGSEHQIAASAGGTLREKVFVLEPGASVEYRVSGGLGTNLPPETVWESEDCVSLSVAFDFAVVTPENDGSPIELPEIPEQPAPSEGPSDTETGEEEPSPDGETPVEEVPAEEPSPEAPPAEDLPVEGEPAEEEPATEEPPVAETPVNEDTQPAAEPSENLQGENSNGR